MPREIVTLQVGEQQGDRTEKLMRWMDGKRVRRQGNAGTRVRMPWTYVYQEY
jgi:hypothetical protein